MGSSQVKSTTKLGQASEPASLSAPQARDRRPSARPHRIEEGLGGDGPWPIRRSPAPSSAWPAAASHSLVPPPAQAAAAVPGCRRRRSGSAPPCPGDRRSLSPPPRPRTSRRRRHQARRIQLPVGRRLAEIFSNQARKNNGYISE